MKKMSAVCFLVLSVFVFAQSKKSVKKIPVQKVIPKNDLEKINDSIPDLIPQRVNGKLGFVNQKGKMIIKPEYNFGTFFWEDCNLLNSPDEKLRKFGTADYASVTADDKDYRIDKTGKKVYTFKKEDLGQCPAIYRESIFQPYIQQGFYGIVEGAKFSDPKDYRQFSIYPQYQYLHVMESSDLKNPMIIASINDLFGVIDIHNNIIIPFEYADIKRNFSWRMARMFEVTKDGKNYYFIDSKNKAY